MNQETILIRYAKIKKSLNVIVGLSLIASILIFWFSTGAIGFLGSVIGLIIIIAVIGLPFSAIDSSIDNRFLAKIRSIDNSQAKLVLDELKSRQWEEFPVESDNYKRIERSLIKKVNDLNSGKEAEEKENTKGTDSPVNIISKSADSVSTGSIEVVTSDITIPQDTSYTSSKGKIMNKNADESDKIEGLLGASRVSQIDKRYTSPNNNPFAAPVIKIVHEIKSIEYEVPYIPNIIELILLIISLLILSTLYITVGIISQIECMLKNLINKSQANMNEADAIERSAYAVTAGVYTLFWVPFWIVLLPFNVLGWLWNKAGNSGIFFLVIVLGVFSIAVYYNKDMIINYVSRYNFDLTYIRN